MLTCRRIPGPPKAKINKGGPGAQATTALPDNVNDTGNAWHSVERASRPMPGET